MTGTNRPSISPRGVVVGTYIQNSTWPNVETYMQYLTEHKMDYKPFNFVQFEMSKETGRYSMYYLNNNDTKNYVKLNPNDVDKFIFGVSNSDPDRPFNKVGAGNKIFENLINDYATNSNKENFVDSLVKKLLQNTEKHYPDKNLAEFMNLVDDKYKDIVSGVSQINSNYSLYWKNGNTRTSTIILVDYDDNVEYYEYNLTDWTANLETVKWEMNSFKFKLKPLYKNSSNSNFNLFNIFSLFYLALKKTIFSLFFIRV
jgi:uncharacterized protein with NRDE domain